MLSSSGFRLSRNTKGFTLIEVLIVLTVVSILSAVGFANFREYSRRQGLVSVARLVREDLRVAQQYALTGKKPSSGNCSSSTDPLDGYDFSILSSTSYVLRARCPGKLNDIKSVTLQDGYTVSALGTGGGGISYGTTSNPLTFKELGHGTTISGGLATIRVTQKGSNEFVDLTVTPQGTIK